MAENLGVGTTSPLAGYLVWVGGRYALNSNSVYFCLHSSFKISRGVVNPALRC